MCDTFVALPNTTQQKSMLFAKSADCEVNEANAVVRIPASKHVPGEAVRTHPSSFRRPKRLTRSC